MQVLDYGRSFIQGKLPRNAARFWVESRTTLVSGGASMEFYQCGSCKSENTFAESDLFKEDNFDFLPIFGLEQGVMFRRSAAVGPPYRDIRPATEWWGGQIYRLVAAPDVTELNGSEQIRQATTAGLPIVARTEIGSGQLRAIIEYPVKTMNICDDRDTYQVDTGPVVLPDLKQQHETPADRMSLAFVAINAADFADFVVETRTPVAADDGSMAWVYHYSQLVSLPARNSLFALGTL